MICLTIALNLAVDIRDNPKVYNPTVKDILRGIMEGITLLCVLFFTITEICNIAMYVIIIILGCIITFGTQSHCSWKLEYFKQRALFEFNYIHIITSLAVYFIIPLRFLDVDLQWMFASLAYVSHGLVIFKYMMAIRYRDWNSDWYAAVILLLIVYFIFSDQ